MKVFISYAREDLEIAKRLYLDLKSLQLYPWLDVEDLAPGDNWDAAINRAMKDSSRFLMLLSRHSLSADRFVRTEQQRALSVAEGLPPGKIFIVPVYLDDSRPADDRLSALHGVNFAASYEAGLQQLVRSIGQAVPFPELPPDRPTLPDTFFVPGRRADVLYGRAGALRFLEKFIRGNQHMCFVYGIGGTGKTAVALEFANRLAEQAGSSVKLIIFVSARPWPWGFRGGPVREEFVVKNTQQLYRKLAQALGKLHLTRMDPDDQFSEISAALRVRGRVLLIMDNWETIDDESLLGTLVNLPDNVKILLTTRVLPQGPYLSLSVGPLESRDAIRFAREAISSSTQFQGSQSEIEKASTELAILCGNIPLALSLAFPHVTSLQAIDDLVRELSTMAVGSSAEETICAIISDYSCQQFKQRHPSAYSALEVLAILPQPVPKEDLRAMVHQLTGSTINLTDFNPFQLLERRTDGLCSLHSMVRAYLAQQLDGDRRQLVRVMDQIASFYGDLSERLVGNPRTEFGRFGDYKRLELHAENIFHVIRWCKVEKHWDHVLRLVANLGYLFRVSELWSEGEELWALAADVAKFMGQPEEAFRFSMYVVYLSLFRGRRIKVEIIDDLYLRYHELLPSNTFRQSYNRASFLRLLGIYHTVTTGSFVTAYRFFCTSLELMERIGSPHGRCRLHNDLADLLLQCRLPKGEELLTMNLEIARQCQDYIEEVRTLRLMGDCSAYRRHNNEAMRWYREAMERSKVVGLPDERYCARHGMRRLSDPTATNKEKADTDDELADREFGNLKNWLESRPGAIPDRILRCLILDWSGVLANDLRITEECQRRTLEKFGDVRISSEEWRRDATMNWRQFLREKISDRGTYDQAVIELERSLADRVEDVQLAPHAEEVLSALSRQGYIVVIYTSQLPSVVNRCLDRLKIRRYVDMLVLSDDLGQIKPSALHFDQLRRTFGLDFAEMAVVDDMEDTIALAKKVGCVTIGCRSLLGQDLGVADVQIETLDALLPLLEKASLTDEFSSE